MPFGGIMENLATFNEKHALPPARNIQEGINNIITAGLLSAFKAYCAPCHNNQQNSKCKMQFELGKLSHNGSYYVLYYKAIFPDGQCLENFTTDLTIEDCYKNFEIYRGLSEQDWLEIKIEKDAEKAFDREFDLGLEKANKFWCSQAEGV